MRLALIALMMVFALPAQAHTVEELEEWSGDWSSRVLDKGFSMGLALEHKDMVSRHLWYFHPQPVAVTTTRSTSPSPSSPDRRMGTNVEQWRGLVSAYFPVGEVERALCIMSYESGGNPNAKNPNSSAAGLFQFLKSTWDNMVPSSVSGGSYSSGQVYDPEANVRSAAWLQAAEGWTQWSPYNRGLCRG